MAVENVGEYVTFEKTDDHYAVVTLNRPKQHNAINPSIAAALDQIVKRTEEDVDIRAVVLTSSHEKTFCAGADLAEIAKGNAQGMVTKDGGFAGFTHQKRSKPWIAVVGGSAFAGGCEIVLACDMIVASHEAKLGLPEVKRGLFAGAGGPYRLTRALPRNIAVELLATGEPLSAERAFAYGMFNYLVDKSELMDAAFRLAKAVSVNAPIAVQETLKVAKLSFDLDDEQLNELSVSAFAKVIESDDAKEGPKAFLEKRAPQWKGR